MASGCWPTSCSTKNMAQLSLNRVPPSLRPTPNRPAIPIALMHQWRHSIHRWCPTTRTRPSGILKSTSDARPAADCDPSPSLSALRFTRCGQLRSHLYDSSRRVEAAVCVQKVQRVRNFVFARTGTKCPEPPQVGGSLTCARCPRPLTLIPLLPHPAPFSLTSTAPSYPSLPPPCSLIFRL